MMSIYMLKISLPTLCNINWFLQNINVPIKFCGSAATALMDRFLIEVSYPPLADDWTTDQTFIDLS